MSLKPADHYALLGRFDLRNSSESNWVKREISKTFIHPEFNASAASQRSHADLAIHQLKTSVEFTNHIRPICLPHGNENVIDIFGDLTGYGESEMGLVHEVLPRDARLRTIQNWKCSSEHRDYWNILAEDSFCARSETSGPCKGEKISNKN